MTMTKNKKQKSSRSAHFASINFSESVIKIWILVLQSKKKEAMIILNKDINEHFEE